MRKYNYIFVFFLFVISTACGPIEEDKSSISINERHNYLTSGDAKLRAWETEVERDEAISFYIKPQGSITIIEKANGNFELTTSEDFQLGKYNEFFSTSTTLYLSKLSFTIQTDVLAIELESESGEQTINLTDQHSNIDLDDYPFIIIHDANYDVVLASGIIVAL